MKRQLSIGTFFSKKPKEDSEKGCLNISKSATATDVDVNPTNLQEAIEHDDSRNKSGVFCENDVGSLVNKSVDDLTKEMLLKNPWVPPPSYIFPVSYQKIGI